MKSKKDLPPVDHRDEQMEYIVKIGHDDGRGGHHVEEMDRDGIWECFRENDGWVKWLDETKS